MTETTDLAHVQEPRSGVPAVQNSAQMLAMIANAASNPAVDADKMVTLAKLATDLQDRERQEEFSRAKVAAIKEMPRVFKRGQNTHTSTRYAYFEDIHDRIMPILARHNLALSFIVGQEGNRVTVEAVLEHANGVQLRGGAMNMPADTGKGRSEVQAVVSSIAYGKRTTMKAILNIIESNTPEDDDGQSGGNDTAPMDPRKRALLDDAEAAAKEGPTFYLDFYKGLDAAAKGWLVFEGHHDKLKLAAQG